MSLFVDTSVWLAAIDAGDLNNARAKEILSTGEVLVTSDQIVLETWTLLRHKLARKTAETFWERTRQGVAFVEPVGPADWEAAWQIGQVFRDQDFSIFDRTSFVVMGRLGIERAASFDADFAIYRYGPRRRRAFTNVR